MTKDNGGGERERLLKQLDQTFEEVTWSYEIALNLTNRMIRLVGQDAADRVPDNYEEIVKQMDALERWYDHLREAIDEARSFRLEHDLDTTHLEKAAVDAEDIRMAMRNLRVDLMRWLKDFECVRPEPTKAERDVAEAEMKEAFRTGGANLVRQEKQQER